MVRRRILFHSSQKLGSARLSTAQALLTIRTEQVISDLLVVMPLFAEVYKAPAASRRSFTRASNLNEACNSPGTFTSPLIPRFAKRATSSACPRDWQSMEPWFDLPKYTLFGAKRTSVEIVAGRSSGIMASES